ncbi:hypothetical protein [Pseudomonas sp.]|uniref:hypothetical protein n=1 Tax=Pseudomonas sp. TaxID=306 RepID=UPI00273525CA|nr:hypothetical protein [Pseudomonas sp.]MDP3816462.1 hypothetical protein [Pseudomonas sp.]
MKKVYAVAALLVVIGGGCYFWVRDEAPSADVQSWLQQLAATPDESAAYLYLAGLDATLEQQPAILGAERLKAYQAWYVQHGAGDTSFVPGKQAQLKLPEGADFCAIEAPDCLTALLAREPAPLPGEQAALLERYRHYLTLGDYHTLTSPSIAEPLAPMQYFSRANQLLTLQALQLAKAGDGAAALALLQDDVTQLRRQLAMADQLVQKMILVAMLNRDLEWLAQLYRRGLVPAPAPLAPLSEAERSLHAALLREFGSGAALFAELGYKELGDFIGNETLGRLALLFVYKPQMTVNAVLPPFQQLSARSQLDPEDFQQAVQAAAPLQASPLSLRNYVGSVLLAIAVPDLNRYIGRLQDLDAKLKLVNLSSQLPPGVPTPEQLAALPESGNPYRPQEPPYWEAEQGRLCFSGPLEDRHSGRCVTLGVP